jgi:predicted CoA-binding protein
MFEKKKTLVLGASDNPSRYSYLALKHLQKNGHPVVAVGKKHAMAGEVVIETEKKEFENIDNKTIMIIYYP